LVGRWIITTINSYFFERSIKDLSVEKKSSLYAPAMIQLCDISLQENLRLENRLPIKKS